MKVLILGYPDKHEADNWKDQLYSGFLLCGHKTEHWPARGTMVDDVITWCRREKPDLFVWARTHGHDPAGDSRAMVSELKGMGIRTVGIHLDLYWGVVARERRVRTHPFFRLDYVFTADGGNDTMWQKMGVNHIWCPPPMSERFFGHNGLGESSIREIVFVGGYASTIHGKHRQQLIRWASQEYGNEFRHWGNGKEKVLGHALSTLYARAWVSVGDSAPSRRYWSDRVPRTLGRGGVLAHPWTEGFEENGFTDECMIMYDRFDFAGLAERIASMTKRDRDIMRSNAMQVIHERHLWENRVNLIIEEVFG